MKHVLDQDLRMDLKGGMIFLRSNGPTVGTTKLREQETAFLRTMSGRKRVQPETYHACGAGINNAVLGRSAYVSSTTRRLPIAEQVSRKP